MTNEVCDNYGHFYKDAVLHYGSDCIMNILKFFNLQNILAFWNYVANTIYLRISADVSPIRVYHAQLTEQKHVNSASEISGEWMNAFPCFVFY